MKYLIILVALVSFAAHSGTPFPPWTKKLLKQANLTNNPAETGDMQKRSFKGVYDFAVNGGAIKSHSMGITIPANAIITKFFTVVATAVTDGGTGTMSFECEDAGNLASFTDYTAISADVLTPSVSSSSMADAVTGIAAACALTATVSGTAVTAGKVLAFGEYYVAE